MVFLVWLHLKRRAYGKLDIVGICWVLRLLLYTNDNDVWIEILDSYSGTNGSDRQ
jgi:hypothetical protein